MMVHPQDKIYQGKKKKTICDACAHTSLPFPLQLKSDPSSLHQQQHQLNLAAQNEGQWQRLLYNIVD